MILPQYSGIVNLDRQNVNYLLSGTNIPFAEEPGSVAILCLIMITAFDSFHSSLNVKQLTLFEAKGEGGIYARNVRTSQLASSTIFEGGPG